MGRVRRVDVGGRVYHAFNRANFRSRLFQQDAHYHDFLLVEEALRKRYLTPFPPCHTYNALGQRVRDKTASGTTDEAYGAGGNLLWRNTGDSNTRSFVPFNGGILAEYYSGGTLFDHPDQLGSITTSTLYNGSPCQERLFYPFGELWTGAGSCGMHQTFAQLPDYDAETDQYNTLNRHYTPMGRWMSPDPDNAGTDPGDPQTWNAYAYVRNNPTTLTDPDGEDADCHYDEKGVLHCVTLQPADPEDGVPALIMTAGTLALPFQWTPPGWAIDAAVAGTLALYCYQTNCLSKLLSKSNDAPPPTPATSSVTNTASPNPGGNYSPKKKTSRNQMDQQVKKGQAPKSVDRVDPAHNPGDKAHVEFRDGNALNNDGTWRHGGRELTNSEKDWLTNNGWPLPK